MLELSSSPIGFDSAYSSGFNKDTTKAIAPTTPDDAQVHNLRGIDYDSTGQVDLAIGAYNKAIELKPNFAEAYNNRGIAYGIKGEYNRAIEDFDQSDRT